MKLIIVCMCVVASWAAEAQPECLNDGNCHDGHFCAAGLSKCIECLKCGDYHRHDGELKCARTAEDCGQCLPGFKTGNSVECVDPLASVPTAGGGGMPGYAWPIIGLAILVAAGAVLLCAVRLLRAKVLNTSTRSSREAYNPREDAEAPLRVPSPPPHDPAPPYNPAALNNNHQPSSPPYDKGDAPADDSLGRRPFVARHNSLHLYTDKESDTNQEAQPFNYPNYVRAPRPPPSYDEALSDESNPAEPGTEEETVPSSWTPEPTANGHPLDLSALLNEARGRTLVRAPDRTPDPTSPPAKLPRLQLTTQDDVDTGDADDDGALRLTGPLALPAPPAAALVGSNALPLPGAAPRRRDRAASPGPRQTPSPPPAASSNATPRETNITINITQQLNNVLAPKIRYDNEPR